jgi:phospho-N-acetylmuramoyl-pentapeptide-transferase
MLPNVIQILLPATVSFIVGMSLTPILTHYLYAYKAWKKTPGKLALDGSTASEFNRLHERHEVRAPRMGGIVIWGSALITILGMALLALIVPTVLTEKLAFLSRNQTWLPAAALLGGALIGLYDDILVIRPNGTGLQLRYRLMFVFLLSAFIGWWFWAKLAVVAINIPFAAPLIVGPLIIPIFMIITLALYASGVIDGIDGLSGGVFSSIFASYAIIAFAQQQVDLAAFCAAILGGLLAFLWFNIPPARFYMSDTGTMALTLALAVIVFMTDNLGGGFGIAALPIIGMLLVLTVLSNVAQVVWKKAFGKKLLRIAPLHHHFESIGWPGEKIVMRYWVLSVIFAFLGVLLAILALPILP